MFKLEGDIVVFVYKIFFWIFLLCVGLGDEVVFGFLEIGFVIIFG